MRKLLNVKMVISVLVATLFFQVFSMNTFAMTSQELPKNFKELSFEERFAWVTENVEGEYVKGKVEDISAGKSVDSRSTRTYYRAQRSSGIKQAGVLIYKFDVTYRWSVENSDPISTIRIELVDVVDYCLYDDENGNLNENSPIVRIDGPYKSYNVNRTIGIGQSEVHSGLLTYSGYHDLFQYATLYYNGDTYLRETGGTTM